MPDNDSTLEQNSACRAAELDPDLLAAAIEQAYNAVLVTTGGQRGEGYRIVYANPAFVAMTGYSLAELLGQTPKLLQGPLTSPDLIADMQSHLANAQFFAGQGLNYRKDGSIYPVEWNISPVRNRQGEVTHYVSVQRDLSVQWAAQHMSQLLASALNVTADAVIVTDASARIEFANDAFVKLSGYPLEELLGNTPALLKSTQHSAEFYAGMWTALRAGQTFRDTFINRHKSGALFYAEQTITPIRDGNGNISNFVSISKDLTARVQREQALLEHASRDGLTGALLRGAGEMHLQQAMESAADAGQVLSIALVDVDHFKRFNDTWGHLVGDEVLRDTAQALTSYLRRADVVVRWGGEEFLLVFQNCGLHEAVALAERCRTAVAAKDHPLAGTVTVSLGVVELRAGETVNSMVARADELLYRAKAMGRNRVCA